MESGRRSVAQRTYVPSAYRILLHPADLLAFDSMRISLTADLGEALHGHARSRGWTLTARPRVELEASRAVATGDVVVHAEPVQPSADKRVRRADERAGAGGAGRVTSAPSTQPPQALPAQAPPAAFPAPPSSAGTSVYAAPSASSPKAVVAVRTPGRSVWRVPVRAGMMRIGRALDNDLILGDDRVSRHHGQFGVRFGTLIYTDLGSTNGSYLNGSAVSEIALGPGDVLQLGASTLSIEQGT
jgi:hypothetical protein